jgi:3-phosphoshikimate 1-carboxyvinyltransferase
MLILNKDNESTISLGGLRDGSRQGDSMVRYIGSLFGLKTAMIKDKDEPMRVVLTKGFRHVQRLDFNFTNCPDLAQTFIVACAALDIPFRFTGLGSLKMKETDRIEAMKTELRKIGVVARDHNETELIWEGGRCEPTWEPFETYNDHRMAMSLAPLAMVHDEIKINNPQVVSKSYPHFWDDLRQAGFMIE